MKLEGYNLPDLIKASWCLLDSQALKYRLTRYELTKQKLTSNAPFLPTYGVKLLDGTFLKDAAGKLAKFLIKKKKL